MTAAEFKEFLKGQVAKYKQIADQAGLKLG